MRSWFSNKKDERHRIRILSLPGITNSIGTTMLGYGIRTCCSKGSPILPSNILLFPGYSGSNTHGFFVSLLASYNSENGKMEHLTTHLHRPRTTRSPLSFWGDGGIVPFELFFMLFPAFGKNIE
jgi:hypothetical protein